ncbi:hypothetical protein CARUB_v10007308mg [Capsella rubella]|uniref:F-box domain-containing protein n=1 Tax=Capsella rubella TaxID=81985 RepID=R0F2B3_9BRAS|nr:hypothetical protein CARUB_v10007308mg [Capsella rubella]
MKSKKKKNVVDGSRDIISGLPYAMLCHILSFLPTKEAASTTALSKRWKPLLAFVPNLDFDDSIYFYPREISWTVSWLLQAKAKSPLNRFQVKCKDVVDQYWVLEWIQKVLKRGVLDIDLRIPTSLGYCSRSNFYPLPSKIFMSKTLVRLKIEFEDGVNFSVDGDVSLPKLKILYLDYFQTDTITFNKLVSGCHVLEELVLVNLKWNWNYLDPMPGYLTFMADRYREVSFDSLVEASVGLRLTPDQIVHVTCSSEDNLEPEDEINLKNLLMGICNVKILFLSCDTLKVLNYCSETIPVFNSLMQLTVEPCVEWESLSALLKNCPNLETLIFQGLQHIFGDKCEDEDGCLCKCPDDSLGTVVRNCLVSSPVKVLKILKFRENCDIDEIEEQIEHVKHFLETMPNLENVTLYYNTPDGEDVMKVCKQLQKIRRVASAKCNVQIISDNLSLSSTI